MSSPHSDPAVNAEAEIPRIAPPWWRNRRRLFYLGLVAVTVGGLWGGWVWWYRADFPVPGWVGSGSFARDYPILSQRIMQSSEALVFWKQKHRMTTYLAEHPEWQGGEGGSTLEFGRDGRLQWVIPERSGPVDAETSWDELGIRPKVNGALFRIIAARRGVHSPFHGAGNLYLPQRGEPAAESPIAASVVFPDMPYLLGYLNYEGRQLTVTIVDTRDAGEFFPKPSGLVESEFFPVDSPAPD